MCTANGIKIICQGRLSNDMSQIRERETVAASDFVPSFGDILKPCSIDPGNGGCHHGKADVIHDSMGIAGLAFTAADVLFDLFKTGFDFPSCAIVLDDLFGSQIEIGREEGNPLCFTKNPDYPRRTFDRFEHDEFCRGKDLAVMSIEKHTVA